MIDKEIENTIQKIQDKTISLPELATFEMRDHHLYWELGILIKKFVDENKISEDRVIDTISRRFKPLFGWLSTVM